MSLRTEENVFASIRMTPAKVNLAGDGLRVDEARSHPQGILYSGGYDADTNELFLSSVMGHPRGVAVAGGSPSNENVSGLRIILVSENLLFWATDSMSLPRGLLEVEADAVQMGLENHFHPWTIKRIEKLENIPKSEF